MASLRLALAAVSDNSACSGCGACALAFPQVSMRLDQESGFLRPYVDASGGHRQPDAPPISLGDVCPGMGSVAPRDERDFDRHLGPYVSVWRAWAIDPEIRHAGSSGGVVTALVDHILTSGEYAAVAGVAAGGETSISSEGVLMTTSKDALGAAGSRYFPATALTSLTETGGGSQAVVAKPCEVAGLRRVEARRGTGSTFAIAVFCAGTPSARATERAIAELGVQREEVVDVRYRGNGWPGRFTLRLNDGSQPSMSYRRAWGEFLGRDIDGLCRICVDGTGMHADLSVGDFWRTDERGYPVFTEGDGESAVIARTARGEALLLVAEARGLIRLERITIDAVRAVQPAQVARTNSLAARMASRRLLGMRTPRYSGYRLSALAWRHPLSTARFFAGTLRRLLRQKRR